MSVIKCSFLSCKKELSVENREVHALSFGKEGHRFLCKEHHDLIKNFKGRITIQLLKGINYAQNKKRSNHFRIKSRPTPAGKGNVDSVRLPEGQGEGKVPTGS